MCVHNESGTRAVHTRKGKKSRTLNNENTEEKKQTLIEWKNILKFQITKEKKWKIYQQE